MIYFSGFLKTLEESHNLSDRPPVGAGPNLVLAESCLTWHLQGHSQGVQQASPGQYEAADVDGGVDGPPHPLACSAAQQLAACIQKK